MSRPIRVLVFLEAQTVTGQARNVLEFARFEKGVALTIAAFRRVGEREPDPLRQAAEAQGVAFVGIPERRSVDFATLGKMRALCSQLRPDILQTHGHKGSFLVWLSGLARRFPWVAWHHGYARPSLLQELYGHLDKVSLRHAHRVVTVSDAFVPQLRRAGVTIPIPVIPNALGPAWMDGCPQLKLDPGKAKMVLAVGRLSKEKAHADLVKALGILRRRGAPQLHLLLVGDGPERQRLSALAEREGVAATFIGHVDDVRPYLTACDYFVLPSQAEGSPNALIEAMMAGVPIVATTVGSVAEMITDGEHGLLAPPSRPDLLAERIGRLLAQLELCRQLGSAAQTRAREQFLPEPRVRRVMAVYADVLKLA